MRTGQVQGDWATAQQHWSPKLKWQGGYSLALWRAACSPLGSRTARGHPCCFTVPQGPGTVSTLGGPQGPGFSPGPDSLLTLQHSWVFVENNVCCETVGATSPGDIPALHTHPGPGVGLAVSSPLLPRSGVGCLCTCAGEHTAPGPAASLEGSPWQ